MKRFQLIGLGLLCAGQLLAITQRGTVRTIARPQHEGEPLEAVVLRVRGSHNAVETAADGSFALLLNNKQNGDAIAFTTVLLDGYELADKELIGRQVACSESVPLQILMVNQQELQREKQQIARKARENVELYYEQQVALFEQQLQEGKIQQAQYQQQIDALEQKYEQFEPLLELMADKFARTDVSQLSEIDVQINTAIENGNLDEAERLIREKGDLQARENQIRDVEQQLQAAAEALQKQKQSLEKDYYNLYSIALSRFQNDTAAYYLCRLAALDTTNADYQKQAGQFLKNMVGDYPKALQYLLCAQRHTADNTVQMAVLTHELGHTYRLMGELDKAETLYKQSLKIRQQQRADYPEETAETMTNLSLVSLELGDYKSALSYQQQALKIWEKVYGDKHASIAVAHNNLGKIQYQQKKYKPAIAEFEKAIQIYENIGKDSTKEIALCYNNMGATLYNMGEQAEALTYFEKALTIYEKVLGQKHPLTINTKNNILYIKQNQ